MDVIYDEAKFREMVMYVADRLRDEAGGASKLGDVLYFADFAHVRRTGRPISGAEYRKLAHGPVARRLGEVRRQLVESGDAELVPGDFLGYAEHRLVPRRAADRSALGADELATIDRVVDDLAHLTATQVSDLSHDEPGWQLCSDGETIPYAAALIAKQQVSTPVSRRLGVDVARRYGIDAGP